MDKNSQLYDFTQNLQGVLYQAGMKHYAEATPQDQQIPTPDYPAIMNIRRGYAESVAWMMVQLYEFHPEPLTVEKFRVRAVYSAPRLSQALLELIASEGWADRDLDDNFYTLTDAGYQFIHNMLADRNAKFANFKPLADNELNILVSFSERIFDYAIEYGDEAREWALIHSQNRKPPTDTPAIAKLIHVCSDFNAWRDDCHSLAFSLQGADGMTWEAFAFVDDEQAQTASALFEKLNYRGWTVNEWQTALDNLAAHGWIKASDNVYIATEKGKSIREAVEYKTDISFYAPWHNVLSAEEQTMYIGLLNKLHDVCMKMLSD